MAVRKGDLIKIIRLTRLSNIGYGELIGDESRVAGMELAPTIGCFNALRCIFAESGESQTVPKSVPGGTSDPPDSPPKPKLVPAKREKA